MSDHAAAVLSDGSSSVQLRVLGYQFPGAQDWDGEWLNIECKARSTERSWTFRSACLLAGEVVSLIAWLGAIANERDGILDPRLEFMEPTIAFSFERVGPGQVHLAAEFALEGSPPGWDSYGHQPGEGLRPFVLSMNLGPDQLREAAESLATLVPDLVARAKARGALL